MPKLVLWDAPDQPFMAEHVPVSRSHLSRAAKAGTIQRIIRGVYLRSDLMPSDPASRHLLHALAMQMRHGNQIVASHETAALALGLPLPSRHAIPQRPRFLCDPDDGRRRDSVPRIWLAPLPAEHVTVISSGLLEGLRVTSGPRTAMDLAGQLPLHFSMMLLDAVARREALRLARPQQLRGEVDGLLLAEAIRPLREAHRVLGRRGGRRRVQALLLADPRRESPGESASAAQIFAAGLPTPEVQVRFATDVGDFFVDFYWPEAALVGECDGAVKYYGGPLVYDQAQADRRRIQEKRRETAIERRGVKVTRWLADEALYRPDAWLHTLAHLLHERRDRRPRTF
ncbi:MAG: hypothetical protein KDC23_08705 [Actinobacteria bacterium]|nr:hypothetical protein [Actinomycetota bacterium]